MTNRYYSPTGAPVTLSRGGSAAIRGEFSLINEGFAAAQIEVDTKGAHAGQVWTGPHNYLDAVVIVLTQEPLDNSTKAANTAYVEAAVSEEAGIRAAAVSEEAGIRAAAVSEEAGIRAAAVISLESRKANLNSPVLTGTPTAPTPSIIDSTQQLATTAFVQSVLGTVTNFKGNWQDLAGELSVPASVYHANRVWLLLHNLLDVTIATPGVSDAWAIASASMDLVTYDNRFALRATTDPDGSYRLVESLGLFRFYSGSTEPDDDETCFATTSGCWLLECPHWDVADAMRMADESAQDDRDEDDETRLTSSETRWPGRVLHGSAACAITSVAAVTQVTFTVSLPGASVGDRVLATPPNALTGRIAFHALVSATDTVTIYLNNPSADAATLVTGTWKLAVFKEI